MRADAHLLLALHEAPTMRVEADAYDQLAVWDSHDNVIFQNYAERKATRLVGLLLAAAPHLAAMLNATERADLTDEQVMVATLDALDKVRDAITEAGELL